MKVMERVIAMTEKRLLDDKGRPYFQLQYYAVNKKGEYAGACAYEGSDFAVADAKGARIEKCAYLFKKDEQPKAADQRRDGQAVAARSAVQRMLTGAVAESAATLSSRRNVDVASS